MISEELCLELQLANVFNFEKELKEQYTVISELLSDANQLLFQHELDAIDKESDAYKKENAPYITSDKYRTRSIMSTLRAFCIDRYYVMIKYINLSGIEHMHRYGYAHKMHIICMAYYNRDDDIRQSNRDIQMNTTFSIYSLPRASKQVDAYKNIASSKFNPVSYDKKNN